MYSAADDGPAFKYNLYCWLDDFDGLTMEATTNMWGTDDEDS